MLLPRPGVGSCCHEPSADCTITGGRVLLLCYGIKCYSHIASHFSPMPCHPATCTATACSESAHVIPLSAGLDSCDDPPALLQELGDALNRIVAEAQEDGSMFRLQDTLIRVLIIVPTSSGVVALQRSSMYIMKMWSSSQEYKRLEAEMTLFQAGLVMS